TIATGCDFQKKQSERLQRKGVQGQVKKRAGGKNRSTAVDVAIARVQPLREPREYVGTTKPFRIITMRSQVEGKLLAMNIEVGDTVRQQQVIGQVDDAILTTNLNQAEAELAARQSEVARAVNQVRNAQVQLEQRRLELLQARIEAQRQQKLLESGAIAKQAAEQADTRAKTTAKAVRAAEEEIATEKQAVAAAKGRVIAQKAVVAQAQERRTQARVISPIAGIVIEKLAEPGNFLQSGNEILKIADLSRVKVEVPISGLDLRKVKVGQLVKLRLDAFPNKLYPGKVKRIFPATNNRLIPVEVVIANSYQRIGSGLLARVNFAPATKPRVVIPQKAIQTKNTQDKSPDKSQGKSKGNITSSFKETTFTSSGNNSTVYVVIQKDGKTKIIARTVTLGEKADGKVEVLSGLKAGERFVVNSGGKPLQDGDIVRMSIISETEQAEERR
ncbi:MAG: HlyD family efflux transporter periplasmic adaptor subunit, partial [Cyanobacteria bacterium J06639_18]